MEYDLQLIGARLQAARKAKGYTQDYVSARADITEKFLSQIERGKAGLSVQTLIALCDILEITPNYVLLPDAARVLGSRLAVEGQEQRAAQDEEMVRIFVRNCRRGTGQGGRRNMQNARRNSASGSAGRTGFEGFCANHAAFRRAKHPCGCSLRGHGCHPAPLLASVTAALRQPQRQTRRACRHSPISPAAKPCSGHRPHLWACRAKSGAAFRMTPVRFVRSRPWLRHPAPLFAVPSRRAPGPQRQNPGACSRSVAFRPRRNRAAVISALLPGTIVNRPGFLYNKRQDSYHT
ncbi:MAG: helix-turn-helix domain-containing protein [Ruthenibacterium lactatiformans]